MRPSLVKFSPMSPQSPFTDVPDAIEEIRAGRMTVTVTENGTPDTTVAGASSTIIACPGVPQLRQPSPSDRTRNVARVRAMARSESSKGLIFQNG